jgi:hypothetical protein
MAQFAKQGNFNPYPANSNTIKPAMMAVDNKQTIG